MAANKEQGTLDRILAELKDEESTRCRQALEELNGLKFSSPAILRELEQLAIHHADEGVRESALQALRTPVHQFVRRSLNKLPRGDRTFLLKQIQQWEDDGLLPSSLAEVISARYDFDILAPQAASVPMQAAQRVSAPVSVAAQPPPSIPTGPRPTLTQTLLSEASIRIYLYLGAFFVIAAALILAAVVEAARLPILGIATLLFGGGALVLRKRLPQPSFALFIVFSFLLPIDANVIEETIGFHEPSLSVYWVIVFCVMAAIWGLSVWLYESRFFSVVAFVSLSLAFYRAGSIMDVGAEGYIFLGMLASLAGLAGVFVGKKWKDTKFSLFVFLSAQAQMLGLLFLSLLFALIQGFDSLPSSHTWLLVTLTWLAAAAFFILSDMLIPFVLFPWMAVAALLPLPWFFLSAFDATQPGYALGFLMWGVLLALASEAAFRLPLESIRKYYWALLAGSLPLFITSCLIALEENTPTLTFTVLALTALLYSALHVLRPRWYAWSAALFSGLAAFFVFFQISSIAAFGVPLVFQVLLASSLLSVPELFTRSPLSWETESRWPTILLGIVVSLSGIALALIDFDNMGRGALALILYAGLITVHAVHSQRAWLGYFAAALEALAVVYALNYLHLDLWLPALSALAVFYYGLSFVFHRRADSLQAWDRILAHSGLLLGIAVSLASLALLKENSGWYMILIALLFTVEMFRNRIAWLELVVEILLTLSLYLLLYQYDSSPDRFSHLAFGASLVWLGGDWLLGRFRDWGRKHRQITLAGGYMFTLLGAAGLWSSSQNSAVALVYSCLYAVFFAAYARAQKEPRLGYLATAFLALAVLKLCDLISLEKQIFPLIGLAVVYYTSGYWLRRSQKAAGWEETFRYSGLGLGAFTALGALLQGTLDASIPIAIAATLFAAEAFALQNVWWALPANAFYLMSYFVLLSELKVKEPQFYSIGAALLGMLTHYLLTRAGSKAGAFIAGMLSQLVLLGTTYIQMVSTESLLFFIVLFLQSMVVLAYGLSQRSRSLVITPIAFAVIGVITVVYSALKGLGPVILIGSTGVLLLVAGIVAVLMRERITRLGEQLSDWKP